MQTFLPYADFAASAAVLDDRRLGKQRVEVLQVLRALVFPSYRGWKNHPATRMWRGFTVGLVRYGVTMCEEWERRGHADAVAATLLGFAGGDVPSQAHLRDAGRLPPWLGLAPLHESHRSSLVRKDPEHYRRYFPEVADDLPYLWPPAAFPRWPVPAGGLPVQLAVAELGWEAPRAGQAAAVEALESGRDVLLRAHPGAGASSAGLLAATCLPGRTVWLSAHAGGTDEAAPPLPSLQAPRQDRPPGKVSVSIARPPTEDDLAALAREGRETAELVFHRPDRLADRRVRAALRADPPSLLVLDDVPDAVASSALRSVRSLAPEVRTLALLCRPTGLRQPMTVEVEAPPPPLRRAGRRAREQPVPPADGSPAS